MLGTGACGTAMSWGTMLLAVSLIASVPVHAESARDFRSSEPMTFEIPPQPLARALEAYSAVTGLDVFYNAALAERRNSAAVTGTLTPRQAIEIILAGSGYVPRVTSPGALTIVAPDPTPTAHAASDQRYEAYFSFMQERINDVLCTLPDGAAGSKDIVLRLWLASSGDVLRAAVLGEGDESLAPFATAIASAKFAPPPAEMPQPVTLVVFPASSLRDQPCAVPRQGGHDSRGAAMNRQPHQLQREHAVQR